MSKRKQTRAIHQAIYKLFRYLSKLVQTAALGFSQWLMRSFLILGRKQRRPANAKAGFVLPTVTLLLLVVSLVIGAILLRTGSRTAQVIGAREEQVIYNAATPAIERAKAKLEYLFLKDKRFPNAPPSDEMLLAMLTNKPGDYGNLTNALPDNENPYVFGDEKSQPNTDQGYLNLNGGARDPAWSFPLDVDGDGNNETVVYSIALKRRDGNIALEDAGDRADWKKAEKQVVRNGPVTTTKINNEVCRTLTQQAQDDGGPVRPTNDADWFQVGSAKLRKTFQVDAIVISNKGGQKRTVATLEFQQDRQLDRGNKWGAWFRYDLEIFPGQPFRWNGAMYTAGNMIVGDGDFTGYLISSRNSCFYTRDASEIKVNRDIKTPPTPDNPSFQGQFVAGKIGDPNDHTHGSVFHVIKEDNNPDVTANNIKFEEGTDSVSNGSLSQIALDPVILFTKDQSQSRESPRDNINRTDNAFYTDRAGAGSIGYFNARKRLLASSETAPFIDDTYRADNRYGPKPAYGTKNERIELNNGSRRNGTNIPSGGDDARLLTNNTVDPLDKEFRKTGLDGYWERRAHLSGLRVIVGERLELGNPFGWVNSPLSTVTNTGTVTQVGTTADRDSQLEFDPLYPATAGTNADKQRRTLRDNLAAVQGTVVYQATPGVPPTAPELPIACIATTAHPGTRRSIENSKNFQTAGQTYGLSSSTFPSDFFTGLGTNGWEYTPPPRAAELRGGGDWGNALRNLANFAGEYQDTNNSGAFPPTQGSRIYPHPYLTMWGNFSNLMRAIYDSSNQSIADNSYLESAACTLGMLAYNVNQLEDYSYGSITNAGTLATALNALFNNPPTGTPNRYSITLDTTGVSATVPPRARVYWQDTDPNRPVKNVLVTELTPDDYITLLERRLQEGVAGIDQNVVRSARLIALKEQIARDRTAGFASFQISSPPSGFSPFNYDPPSPPPPAGGSPVNDQFELVCSSTVGSLVNSNRDLGLLCPSQPKFPALYYVFPQNAHDRTGIAPASLTSGSNAEPYLNPSPVPALPAPRDQFQPVNLDTLANQVRPRTGSWSLPKTTGVDPNDPLADFNITNPNGIREGVSLIDNALYNGRELMTVRTLDLDLELLRTNTSPTNDRWLPASGVVYAFREDAVREDAISRPSGGADCDTNNAIRNDGCLIRTDISNPRDPQISADKRISPKPVDYFPDPDRRPHGFRLRNGRRLDRPGTPPRGLTFVSDNPVYIQGDFNYHSSNGTSDSRLEEFSWLLEDDWGNFYDRGVVRGELDRNFAKAATDTWRPAEILADAITILSDRFQEGSIDRGIMNDNDGGRTGATDGRYSFRAMNGPQPVANVATGGVNDNGPDNGGWVLENGLVTRFDARIPPTPVAPVDPTSPPVPLKISRNGNPIYCSTNPARIDSGSFCPLAQQTEYGTVVGQTYRLPGDFDARDAINQASQTRVNATLISGIVPSRLHQTYGGFHNFPRFIERWGRDTKLFISGSFVQLNFSTYATAPFEHNQWQPATGDPPSSGDNPIQYIRYYAAPERQWGYDVGLQYAPAGPVAQRFLQPPAQRSEFYRELPANDAYICQLRLAPGVDQNAQAECSQN
jgi:hypothetical protein